MKNYTIDKLIEIFTEHASEVIERDSKNKLNDKFNFPKALLQFALEIKQLKEK